VNNDKEAIVISDIPLLIEVGWHKAVDIVILVYTSPDVQAERIMKRNNYSYEEARDRLMSQMPVDEKIPFADFVINNEGTPEETEAIVDRIWKELLKKGGVSRLVVVTQGVEDSRVQAKGVLAIIKKKRTE